MSVCLTTSESLFVVVSCRRFFFVSITCDSFAVYSRCENRRRRLHFHSGAEHVAVTYLTVQLCQTRPTHKAAIVSGAASCFHSDVVVVVVVV